MDTTILSRIEEWTKPPFDSTTAAEVEALREKGDMKELEDRFYRMLEFGTGGLRGIIGAGTNRMNIYTVGMATQGLANYIVKTVGRERGVVIARDSRRLSDVFARETASILAGNGIPVYFFEDITPTPLASFAIRHCKAVSGVVITASHNPPEYNGYKVYWEDGGQIIPPHDQAIIDEVRRIDSIRAVRKLEFDQGVSSGVITILRDEITEAYIRELERHALRPVGRSRIRIAYTPLHGTGYRIIPFVLKHFGFEELIADPEQSVPDGSFPTVASPNPEERAALAKVVECARRENADILLATDPDADRMGVGIRGPNGEYILLNGNQIGTMLEYYLLSRLRESGSLPLDGTVIKTIVTTELQRDIANDFGCRTVDVLTGFKWIAAKIKEIEESHSGRFIFGGEESYGYLPVPFVRDKDAISSCYFFAEMADWLAERGERMYEFLEGIYLKYGLYHEDLHSLTLKGKEGLEKIRAIMERFRREPPRSFGSATVTQIADYRTGLIRSLPAGAEEKILGIPSSDVLQFHLEDGARITMRPSGTEPKIKFYFSVRKEAHRDSLDSVRREIGERIAALKNDLMKLIETS